MVVKKFNVKDARFITLPVRRKIAGLKQFVFDTQGKFIVIYENNKVINFVIPVGFICDSTSLPWAVDSAGDAHDFGYCVQGATQGYTKAFWDDVFYFLMIDIGMPVWRAKIRYYGVKFFGAVAYNNRRAEKYQVLRMQAVHGVIKNWGV